MTKTAPDGRGPFSLRACFPGAAPVRAGIVILADAFDRAGIAPGLNTIDFYQNAWRRLSPNGVFVMNLCRDRADFASYLAKIRHVFREFMTLPVRRAGNLVVFAIKDGPSTSAGNS